MWCDEVCHALVCCSILGLNGSASPTLGNCECVIVFYNQPHPDYERRKQLVSRLSPRHTLPFLPDDLPDARRGVPRGTTHPELQCQERSGVGVRVFETEGRTGGSERPERGDSHKRGVGQRPTKTADHEGHTEEGVSAMQI